MAIKDHWNNPEKQARAAMELAEKQSRKNLPPETEKKEETEQSKPTPQRYRLYDKINVSLKTMDIIVYAVAAALVIAIVVGIALGPG